MILPPNNQEGLDHWRTQQGRIQDFLIEGSNFHRVLDLLILPDHLFFRKFPRIRGQFLCFKWLPLKGNIFQIPILWCPLMICFKVIILNENILVTSLQLKVLQEIIEHLVPSWPSCTQVRFSEVLASQYAFMNVCLSVTNKRCPCSSLHLLRITIL